MHTHAPRPTLFPYTTLFRSLSGRNGPTGDGRGTLAGDGERVGRIKMCGRRIDGIDDELGEDKEVELFGSAGLGIGGLNGDGRSEEHTSELQSRGHLVCRLLL